MQLSGTIMAQKAETVFRVRVTKFLKTLNNAAYFPIQQVAIRGTPDFLLCVKGHFIALELKRDDKQGVKGLQAYNRTWIMRCGGDHFVVTPENWEMMKIFLTLKGMDICSK